METITERAVKLCFPLEKVQKIVCSVLKKNEIKKKDEKVPSLEFLAIKTTMRRRMKEDIYAKVLCQLVFKETVSTCYFAEGAVFGNEFRHFRRRGIDPSPAFAALRKDPQVMLAVFGQRRPKLRAKFLMTMFENVVRVAINGKLIAEIRREGFHDLTWADRFVRVAFLTYYPHVIFEWKKKEHQQWEDLRVETDRKQLLATCNLLQPWHWEMFDEGMGRGTLYYYHYTDHPDDATKRFEYKLI